MEVYLTYVLLAYDGNIFAVFNLHCVQDGVGADPYSTEQCCETFALYGVKVIRATF